MGNATIGRYARIIMDDWFKRSFGVKGRERLLGLFLKELIPERTIQELRYEPQEHINPFSGNKSVRIDVECTDEDGTRFVVEMQLSPQQSFYDRAVFNSTFAVQQQLAKWQDDYSFPTVYFIGLVDFSIHKGSDQVLYRYNIREINSNELMTPHLQYIFLELPNCRKALTPQASVLDNICYALHNMEHLTDRPAELKEEIFKLLFDSAEIANFTPEEKVKYELSMRTERDLRNQIAFAKEEGFEIGRQEGIREVARRLLSQGVSLKTVAEGTGLSEEEVSLLAQES